MLGLIKLSWQSIEPQPQQQPSQQQQQLELKSLLSLIGQIDPLNVVNGLGVFTWLRVDPKRKWDQTKPIRFNQDNQREDDLRRLREISSYLVKCKLVGESLKPQGERSPIANALAVSNSSSNTTTNTYLGGMYCRIENEWKHRHN